MIKIKSKIRRHKNALLSKSTPRRREKNPAYREYLRQEEANCRRYRKVTTILFSCSAIHYRWDGSLRMQLAELLKEDFDKISQKFTEDDFRRIRNLEWGNTDDTCEEITGNYIHPESDLFQKLSKLNNGQALALILRYMEFIKLPPPESNDDDVPF